MKLQKIEKKVAKNGSDYYSLTVDDLTYNFWEDLGELKEGDEVDCQFEKKGIYTNLITIRKSNSPNTESNTALCPACRAFADHLKSLG